MSAVFNNLPDPHRTANVRLAVADVSGDGDYDGNFKGSRTQLRLVPAMVTGNPTTGTHQVGEIVLEHANSLFICTVGGTPAT